MTFEAEQEGLPQVCPYLGLADDADSHATYATEAHRCYRLPTPTRIATTHQENYCLGERYETCPVYQGEGVARTAAPMPPPVVPPQAQSAGRTARVQGPPPGSGARPTRPRPDGPRRPAGSVGPRPRAGGISMPVATIGLFVLAGVVILIALLISKAVGNNESDTKAYDPGVLATTAALKTAQAGKTPGGQTTQQGGQPTQPAVSVTPGTPGTGTAVATRTGTPGTPGASGKTYTVKAGDTCGAIATANNITLKELLDLNKITEDDCTKLQVGQTLKLP